MSATKRTAKQAEAARRNGAKSHGPITLEGKARSSQNALKHGITARDVVLGTEDPQIYATYRQIFLEKFQPADNYELDLIEQLTGIAWRIRRAESTETALIDLQIDTSAAEIKSRIQNPDPPVCWAVALTKLSDESNSLINIDRIQHRLSRQFARVRTELDRVQSARFENWENEPGDLEAA